VTGGTLDNKTDGLNASSRNTVNVSGLNNDGVLVTGGTFNDYETKYVVSGTGTQYTGNNGLAITGGTVKLYHDKFEISGKRNNGVALENDAADPILYATDFTIEGDNNNGIIVTNGKTVAVSKP